MFSNVSDCELENNVDTQWKNLHLQDEETKKADPLTFMDNKNKAFRMMKMMGYKNGAGLGKNEQGITLPVEVQPQLGKRGLGLEIIKLPKTDEQWDFSLENNNVEEKVCWLKNDSNIQLQYDDMKKWPCEGDPSDLNECNFCNESTMLSVKQAKNIFDELDLKELCQARAKANPFETIRSAFFMNRAALKMANIDAATDFMFSNIDHNPHFQQHKGPYYFSDVCAGPGGFSEYLLWRKKWLLKGFGFTLREENDFKLSDSTCASDVTFLPLYGAKDDGDVCCPENIKDFKTKVMHETGTKGVHFMMSDGGFSVEGNENRQEVLSKNIYICQCLVALEILRKHGLFVTKLFDVFTNFSVGLLYLMYTCFEKVGILKPNSSRPANSERYFICYNLKSFKNVKYVRNYLRDLVERLWELKDNSDLDILEIVPLSIIKEDNLFFRYICESNNLIAQKQTVSLNKLAVFCRNPTLTDYNQEILRTKCLDYWRIPDKPKCNMPKLTIEDLLSATIQKREFLLVQPRELNTNDKLEDIISDLSDWNYVPMQCKRSTNICNFYAGIGGSKVYRLQYNKWVRVKNIQLVRGTLLYGELVKESITKPTNSKTEYSLHVIDALRLGDISLTDFNFQERNDLIATYCTAVNNVFRTNTMKIRIKSANHLEDLVAGSTNWTVSPKNSNYSLSLPKLDFQSKQEVYDVNSIMLLKTNENQSFHSTYVLRMQFFIEENDEKYLSFSTILDFLRQKNRK